MKGAKHWRRNAQRNFVGSTLGLRLNQRGVVPAARLDNRLASDCLFLIPNFRFSRVWQATLDNFGKRM